MKITVIGAGAIGSAVAQYFSAMEAVEQLQVCDARARSLQDLHDQISNNRVRSFQVDARDPNVLEPVLRGSAVVVSCLPPDLNPPLARLALSLGIHFCDLGGNDPLVRQELALDDEARQKGVWIVPNCGLAPGLVNVLCVRGMEHFDAVERAHLRVGDVPLHPEPPFNFRISWSADKVLDDYTQPVQVIQDGRTIECLPLENEEALYFPEPFGRMEAFCTAGSLSTLLDDVAGRVRHLDHKTIRWPGHANQMRFLLGLGFGEDMNIDVRTHLTYRDVLTRRMRQRLGGPHEDAVLLRVLIQGRTGGAAKTLVYEMVDHFDATTGQSAVMRCTSIPTATVAYLIAAGAVPGGGAAPPERIVPKAAFFEIIAEQGLHITTRWYDGHVGITQPEIAQDPLERGTLER